GTDEEKILDVARQLEAGMVFVNDWHVLHPAYPFGGYKQSGLGREGGPDALDEYTEQKYISVDRSGGVQNKAYALVLGTPTIPHPPPDQPSPQHRPGRKEERCTSARTRASPNGSRPPVPSS